MKKVCVFLLVFFIFLQSCSASNKIGNLSNEEKLYGLSLIWKEASYNFAFWNNPDLPDWDEAYREAIPRVLSTKNTYEYYMELTKFLALLQDGHTQVYMPGQLTAKLGMLPILLKNIEGDYYIEKIDAKLFREIPFLSKVVKINDIPVKQYIEENIYPYIWHQIPQNIDYLINLTFIFGYPGTKEKITYVTLEGVEKDITLKRKNTRFDVGHMMPVIRNNDYFDSVIHTGNDMDIYMIEDIAYINIKSFENNSPPDIFYQYLPEIMDAKGFMFDVRLNGGGNSYNGDQIAAAFTGGEIHYGSWLTLEHIASYKAWQYENYASNSNYKVFEPSTNKLDVTYDLKQPVVILTGRNTASAAEDFVIAFDTRATRVGEPTFGSTGMPLMFELPGGGFARICTRHQKMPDGTEFINKGIQPHVFIEPTLDDYIHCTDGMFLEGIRVLKEKISQ